MDLVDKDRGMTSDQLLPVDAKPAFNDMNIADLIYIFAGGVFNCVTAAAAAADYRYVAT